MKGNVNARLVMICIIFNETRVLQSINWTTIEYNNRTYVAHL